MKPKQKALLALEDGETHGRLPNGCINGGSSYGSLDKRGDFIISD